jgi:hypothetical protein
MTTVIYKNEVEEALIKMEVVLFNGRDNQNNLNMHPVFRFMAVFSEAYLRNYFPEESVLLRDSYKLLKEKGCYYTHEAI